MKRAFALLTLAAALGGCGEEEVSNSQPEVFRGDAVCRSLDVSTFTLNRVEVYVYDADGAADLDTAVAVVESTPLEMTFQALGAEAADGRKCDGECVGYYLWERTPSSEQIFCGDDGSLLEIDFQVTDKGGLPGRAFIASRPPG